MAANHILSEASDFIDAEASDRLVTEDSTDNVFIGSSTQHELREDPFSISLIFSQSIARSSL